MHLFFFFHLESGCCHSGVSGHERHTFEFSLAVFPTPPDKKKTKHGREVKGGIREIKGVAACQKAA